MRERSLAYDFAIGSGRFDDSFVNPALLAQSGLRQTRVKFTNGRSTRVLSETELEKFMTLWTGCRHLRDTKTGVERYIRLSAQA